LRRQAHNVPPVAVSDKPIWFTEGEISPSSAEPTSARPTSRRVTNSRGGEPTSSSLESSDDRRAAPACTWFLPRSPAQDTFETPTPASSRRPGSGRRARHVDDDQAATPSRGLDATRHSAPSPSDASGADTGRVFDSSTRTAPRDMAGSLRLLKSKRMSQVDKHLRVMSASAVLGTASSATLSDERRVTTAQQARPAQGLELNADETHSPMSFPSYTPKLRRYPASAPVPSGGVGGLEEEALSLVSPEDNGSSSGPSRQVSSGSWGRGSASSTLNSTPVDGPHSGHSASSAQPMQWGKNRKSIVAMNAKPVDYTHTDELAPLAHPETEMRTAVERLQSGDWSAQMAALTVLRSMCLFHSEIVVAQVHDVVRLVLGVVDSLRSSLSKAGIMACADMFVALKGSMDPEIERMALALTKKAGESASGFIADEAKRALTAMTHNATPTRVLSALIQCTAHKAPAVRSKVVFFLDKTVDELGPSLASARDVDRLVSVLSTLLGEGAMETRAGVKKTLVNVHSKVGAATFEALVKKLADTEQAKVREVVSKARSNGMASVSGVGLSRTLSADSDQSGPGSSRRQRRTRPDPGTPTDAAFVESVMALTAKLSSGDHNVRKATLEQLFRQLSEHDPGSLGNKLGPVLEALAARCGENNVKVAQFALDGTHKLIERNGPTLEPCVTSLVSVLATNLASSTLANKSSETLDALAANVDCAVLVEHFASAAKYGKPGARALMLEKLRNILPSVYTHSRHSALLRHIVPMALSMLDESKPDVRAVSCSFSPASHHDPGQPAPAAVPV